MPVKNKRRNHRKIVCCLREKIGDNKHSDVYKNQHQGAIVIWISELSVNKTITHKNKDIRKNKNFEQAKLSHSVVISHFECTEKAKNQAKYPFFEVGTVNANKFVAQRRAESSFFNNLLFSVGRGA